jgi:hypothetical protein
VGCWLKKPGGAPRHQCLAENREVEVSALTRRRRPHQRRPPTLARWRRSVYYSLACGPKKASYASRCVRGDAISTQFELKFRPRMDR